MHTLPSEARKKKAGLGGDKLTVQLPVGASGEIVKDAQSPILPISPKLYPKGAQIKEPGKAQTALQQPPPPVQSKTKQQHSHIRIPSIHTPSEGEMTALDLGDAALEDKKEE